MARPNTFKSSEWYGEHLGMSDASHGSLHALVVGGFACWPKTLYDDDVDAFVRDLGRCLGWTMPKGKPCSLRIRRHRGQVIVRFPGYRPVAENKLSRDEAERAFQWLCRRFGWVDT